jgi:hypothetical protein
MLTWVTMLIAKGEKDASTGREWVFTRQRCSRTTWRPMHMDELQSNDTSDL